MSVRDVAEAAGVTIGSVSRVLNGGRYVSAELRAKVMAAAQQQDLMILQAGPDVVRFAPSLVISDADIDEGMARLERALASLTAA